MEQSMDLGKLAFLPAAIGFDRHLLYARHRQSRAPFTRGDESEGMEGVEMKRSTCSFSPSQSQTSPRAWPAWSSSAGSATMWPSRGKCTGSRQAVGLAIQNFPEGAIVSPSHARETRGHRAETGFGYGVLSGVVEPVASVITMLLLRRGSSPFCHTS